MIQIKCAVTFLCVISFLLVGINSANSQSAPNQPGVCPYNQNRMMQGRQHGMGNQGQQGMGMMNQDPNLSYDQNFLNRMIMHQQMGIKMAQQALQSAQHPELKEIAKEIIEDNTESINEMQKLRQQWYRK